MASHSPDHEEAPVKSNEYFELRIPKISNGRVPLLFTLLLMLASFLGGLVTMKAFSESGSLFAGADMTNATGVFTSYAKQLKLDTKEFTSCMDAGKYADVVANDIENGTSFDVSATPTFFINGRPLIGAQPYTVFEQMIEQEISGNRSPLTPEEASGPAQLDVAKGHLPVLGKEDATITIVEFSDFQCPFCERFFVDTLPELKKNYIDTGKAQLTFRHFPLTSIHPNAETAHRASECANEQGKFWEYHDLLFQNQSAWSDLPLTEQPSSV